MTKSDIIRVPANLLAAVAVAQATDCGRPYICGVCFEAGAMVATDGIILTAAQIDYRGPSLILPIPKKAQTAARGKRAAYATYDPAAGLLQVLAHDESALHLERAAPIDGTFPDWRRIVSRELSDLAAGVRESRAEGRPDPAVSGPRWFAPGTLARIAETARYVAPNGSICIVGLPDRPQLVRYAGDSAIESAMFSVAMPMRSPDGVTADTAGLEWIAEGTQAAAA